MERTLLGSHNNQSLSITSWEPPIFKSQKGKVIVVSCEWIPQPLYQLETRHFFRVGCEAPDEGDGRVSSENKNPPPVRHNKRFPLPRPGPQIHPPIQAPRLLVGRHLIPLAPDNEKTILRLEHRPKRTAPIRGHSAPLIEVELISQFKEHALQPICVPPDSEK